MANYPKKANDPTEAALSAIQDALNMRDSEETLEQPHPDIRFDAQSFEAVQGEPHPQLPFEDELPPFPAAVRREDARRRAANDDRETIGQVLQSLQRRATRTPYIVAALFTAAWVVSAVGLAFGFWGELKGLFAQASVAVPLAVALLTGLAAPILFFFVLAPRRWGEPPSASPNRSRSPTIRS